MRRVTDPMSAGMNGRTRAVTGIVAADPTLRALWQQLHAAGWRMQAVHPALSRHTR